MCIREMSLRELIDLTQVQAMCSQPLCESELRIIADYVKVTYERCKNLEHFVQGKCHLRICGDHLEFIDKDSLLPAEPLVKQ